VAKPSPGSSTPVSGATPAWPARTGGILRGAAWTLLFAVLAALFHGVASSYHHADGSVVGPAVALVIGVYSALIWCAYTALVLRLARVAPVERGRVARRVALHLAVGASLGVVTWLVYQAQSWAFDLARPVSPLRNLAGVVLGHVLLYVPLSGTAHGLEYARRIRLKEVDELRLRTELSEAELSRARAELRVLKLELNPHFLFNALHTVSSLMHDDVRRANGVLVSIGELLRRALDWAGGEEVSLEEEVEFLRAYVKIEQARLGERLRVEWEVEEEALDAAVPHLLLQPLVENALKHGIGPRGGGTVRIGAACEGERLRVWVEDDGLGVREAEGPRRHRSVGVGNVTARLEQLYGGGGSFSLSPGAEGGARAEALLPLHAPAVSPRRSDGGAAHSTAGIPAEDHG